jgi:hypothetical protein
MGWQLLMRNPQHEEVMNLRIGSQPRIAATTSVETEVKPTTEAETKQEASPVTAGNTSIRAESQFSAVALYSKLNNELQPVNRFQEKTIGKQEAKFRYIYQTRLPPVMVMT